MTSNPFGKPLVLNVYLADEDGNTLVPDDSESPDIYLFENAPTRTQARTGDGAMAGFHLTSWTGTEDFRTVIFPAVPDKSPDSPVSEWTYFVAVNFKLDADGDRQTLIKSVRLRRVSIQSEILQLSQADLEAIDKSVANVFGSGSTTIDSINATVIRLLKARFRAKHFEWDRIKDPTDLKDAAVFLALHFAFASQVRAGGDSADRKQDIYKKTFESLIDTAVLSYIDASGDDTEETETEIDAGSNTWSFDR